MSQRLDLNFKVTPICSILGQNSIPVNLGLSQGSTREAELMRTGLDRQRDLLQRIALQKCGSKQACSLGQASTSVRS